MADHDDRLDGKINEGLILCKLFVTKKDFDLREYKFFAPRAEGDRALGDQHKFRNFFEDVKR